MIGVLQITKEYEAVFMYVNCQHCGEPLVTEKQRLDGFCEECFGLTDEDVELINRYDPYGQPILEEVAA